MNQRLIKYEEGFRQAAVMIYYQISQIPANQLNLKSIENVIETLLRNQE